MQRWWVSRRDSYPTLVRARRRLVLGAEEEMVMVKVVVVLELVLHRRRLVLATWNGEGGTAVNGSIQAVRRHCRPLCPSQLCGKWLCIRYGDMPIDAVHDCSRAGRKTGVPIDGCS